MFRLWTSISSFLSARASISVFHSSVLRGGSAFHSPRNVKISCIKIQFAPQIPKEFNLKWCLELFCIMSHGADRKDVYDELVKGIKEKLFLNWIRKDGKKYALMRISREIANFLLWRCFRKFKLMSLKVATTSNFHFCFFICFQVTTRQRFQDETLQLPVIRQHYSNVCSILVFLWLFYYTGKQKHRVI